MSNFFSFPKPGGAERGGRSDNKKWITAEKFAAVGFDALFNNEPGAENKKNQNDENENRFWMEDHMCKECYSCEKPFSLITRRHHCRVCGRIFCNACSRYTVNGKPYGYTSAVRACTDCFNIVKNNHADKSPSVIFNTGAQQRELLSLSRAISTGSTGSISAGESSSFSSSGIHGTAAVAVNNMLKNDLHDVNNSNDTDENMNKHRSRPFSGATKAFTGDIKSVTEANRDDSLKTRKEGKQQQEQQNSQPLNGHEQFLSRRQRGSSRQLILLTEREKQLMNRETCENIEIASDCRDCDSSSEEKPYEYLMSDDTHELLSKFKTALLGRLCKKMIDKTNLNFGNSKDLDNDDNIVDINANANVNAKLWSEKLVSLSEIACRHVKPRISLLQNATKTDVQNIGKYIQSVVIAGGERENCSVVNGVLLKRNVAHRKMKKYIQNPRIMIIKNSVEFLREESRFASLEVLHEQEKQYMELVVNKIVNVGVDVLLVGRFVSRLGQELLLASGISLVLNIDDEELLRVSRLTNTSILPSIDHLTKTSIHTGSCALYRVKSFNDSDRKHDTYICFEGCPPKLGCTICLRGEDIKVLDELKAILDTLVLQRYWATYELKLLQDMGASYGLRGDDMEANLETSITLLEQKEVVFTRVYINGILQSTFPGKKLFKFSSEEEDVVLGKFLIGVSTYLKSAATQFSNSHNVVTITEREQFQSQTSFYKKHRVKSGLEENSRNLNSGTQSTIRNRNQPESGKKPTNIQFSSIVYIHGTGRVRIKFENLDYTTDNSLANFRLRMLNLRRSIVAERITHIQNEKRERFLVSDHSKDPLSDFASNSTVTGNFLLVGGTCKVCGAQLKTCPVSREAAQLSFGRFLMSLIYQSKVFIHPYGCQHNLFRNYVIFFEYYGIISTFEFEYAQTYTITERKGYLEQPSKWVLSNTKQHADAIVAVLSMLKVTLIERENTILSQLQSSLPDGSKVNETKMGEAKKVFEDAKVKLEELQLSLEAAVPGGIFAVNDVRRELVLSVMGWNETLQDIQSSVTVQRPDSTKSFKRLPSLWTRAESTGSTSSQLSNSSQSLDPNILNDNISAEIESSENHLDALPLEIATLPCNMLEGHPLLGGRDNMVTIFAYEDEPTSLIAHALASKSYNEKFRSMVNAISKPVHLSSVSNVSDLNKTLMHSLASFLELNPSRNKCQIEVGFVEAVFDSITSSDAPAASGLSTTEKLDLATNVKRLLDNIHADSNVVENEDVAFQFQVKIHCALQFHALRTLYFENSATDFFPCKEFLQSLSRCSNWNTSGGKTKANFFKTEDDRYVLKTITIEELEMFHALSSNYFAHMKEVLCDSKKSALMKILGVFTITVTKSAGGNELTPIPTSDHGIGDPAKVKSRESTTPSPISSPNPSAQGVNAESNAKITTKIHFLLMEKLFTEDGDTEDLEHFLFDLKGNLRNRYVSNPTQDSVLLDVNFFEAMEGVPITLSQSSKADLLEAIKSDTLMLQQAGIVDYSLLALVPKKCNSGSDDTQIRIGIVDYLQLYNYRKIIESSVKRAAMLAGQLEPTVIEPLRYRERFIKSMDRYFTGRVKPLEVRK